MRCVTSMVILLASAAGGSASKNGPAAARGSSILSFNNVKTDSWTHPKLGYTVKSDTYLSVPMDLAPGEMVFTNQETTKLQMPPAGLTGYAITGFMGEIVYSNNESAPLSKIYDHHWIAVQYSHHNELCNGNPEYVVGIGAESRNTKDSFPDGYGYVVKPGENKWGANIHLLHTEHLAGDPLVATKECNECYYAEGKGPTCNKDQNGTFECCGQDCPAHTCRCPTTPDAPTERTTFYLRYQVNYTYDLKQVTPMKVGVITTPECELFYDVFENNDEPERVDSANFIAPSDVEAIYAVGHQHVGGINISMFVNDEFVCASFPRYGTTPDKAGDEFGYLVEMSTCIDKDTTGSVHVKKGDKIRLDSWYWVGSTDERIHPHPGGTHLNVMGYMYLGYL